MNALEAARRVEAVLDEVRRSQQERHGWTLVEVNAEVHAAAQRVVLHGEVVVDRVRRRLAANLQEVLPSWGIDVDSVRTMEGGTWHALPRTVIEIQGSRPGPGQSDPGIELRHQDGPVQCLAKGEGGDANLIRCRDGTVGWLPGPLGAKASTPRLPVPWCDRPAPFVRSTSAWIDVPYKLGGVTDGGIDCSALVQRLAADVLGVTMPRHSSDQLHVGPNKGPGLGPGDLVFVWNDEEAKGHVGICTGLTVVHASRSRGQVVADPLSDFLRGASTVMHVPFKEVVAFGQQVAGASSLVAAGFELGRPVTV